MNPQMSEPTRGIPKMFMRSIPWTERPMYSSVATLSPSHLDPYLPIPATELLVMMKGLLLFLVNHSAVAFVSRDPNNEWVSRK